MTDLLSEILKAAYDDGAMALLLGEPERACPYDARQDRRLHAAWRMGWAAARRYQDSKAAA